MCAIGGEIDFASPVKVMDYHKEMISSMKRRGPDDDGIFQDENALLLHARLAVIDVEKGRQPMTFCYRGETYTIVYNGEIYNTKELRKNLENMGMVFETSSDTEVLLKLYAVYKEECTEMLNGIFA